MTKVNNKLGQAQPAARLVKLLVASFSTADLVFDWSKISLQFYWIDVQLPLIRQTICLLLRFVVIGNFQTFPVRFWAELGFGKVGGLVD